MATFTKRPKVKKTERKFIPSFTIKKKVFDFLNDSGRKYLEKNYNLEFNHTDNKEYICDIYDSLENKNNEYVCTYAIINKAYDEYLMDAKNNDLALRVAYGSMVSLINKYHLN